MTAGIQTKPIFAAPDSLECQDIWVGMFDILGFQEIITNTRLEDVLGRYVGFELRAGLSAQIPEFSARSFDLRVVPHAFISDTIILWSRDDKDNTEAFLSACADLIARSVDQGWPIRGGIAFGECIMDRTTNHGLGTPDRNGSGVDWRSVAPVMRQRPFLEWALLLVPRFGKIPDSLESGVGQEWRASSRMGIALAIKVPGSGSSLANIKFFRKFYLEYPRLRGGSKSYALRSLLPQAARQHVAEKGTHRVANLGSRGSCIRIFRGRTTERFCAWKSRRRVPSMR